MNKILKELVRQTSAFNVLKNQLDYLACIIDDINLEEEDRKIVNEYWNNIFELVRLAENERR